VGPTKLSSACGTLGAAPGRQPRAKFQPGRLF
jgi:hypothetical protein